MATVSSNLATARLLLRLQRLAGTAKAGTAKAAMAKEGMEMSVTEGICLVVRLQHPPHRVHRLQAEDMVTGLRLVELLGMDSTRPRGLPPRLPFAPA